MEKVAHNMPDKVTKRLNRDYKARNRQANLAARRETNRARANNKKNPPWAGVTNPPAPHKPKF